MAGKFVWFDLNTTDVQGAISFYTKVVGWETEEWSGMPYTMFKPADGPPIGGVNELHADAAARGVPSHWLGHVAVPDVDEAVAKVLAGGGRVLSPVVDVPTVGRMATVGDPWGAVFSVFQPAGEPPAATPQGAMGVFCWAELMTKDIDTALGFYGGLFGWTRGDHFDMPGGKYVFMRGVGSEQAFGGVMVCPDGMPFGAWVYYFTVPDLDASVAIANANGGTMHMPIMDVPGGRIAMMMDPQGGTYALWSAPLAAAS